jgi:UDP-N-acetylmuramate: L-alanyl-gamma-D-glutamyl-meso-diaminopimelate ligase
VKARGRRAREAESFDGIVRVIVREHRRGDLVVLMSNGGFGGIHQKLVQALGTLAPDPRVAESESGP